MVTASERLALATLRAQLKAEMDSADAHFRATNTPDSRAAYKAAYSAYWSITELPKARGYASRAGQRQFKERNQR